MATLIWLAKQVGTPGSIGFLALCCALGLLFAARGGRGRRLAEAWLLLIFVGYVIAGLPVVAHAIADRLSAYRPLDDLSTLQGADLLVVLSGDNVRGRAREARRILDAVDPRCVVASGGEWFTDVLVEAGIDRERLTVDPGGETTRDQMDRFPRWIKACSAERPVVVASRLQMPRVEALARVRELPLLLAPSPIDDEPPVEGLRLFVPSYISLRVSRDATYEHAALAYYRYHRWIAEPTAPR